MAPEEASVTQRTPISSTIILSKPEGPKELLTTFEIACVATTGALSAMEYTNGAMRHESTILISNIGSTDFLAAEN